MSKKDAYYFPHDSNAKDDPKCSMLIESLGLEGYGIYWVLIENLRDQPDYRYPFVLIPSIARKYNTTVDKVKAVVTVYGLFEYDENSFFFSNSLIERMLPLEEKREKNRIAGKISAEKRKQNLIVCSTDVQHLFNTCSTDVATDVQPIEESKVEESKVEDKKTLSTVSDKSDQQKQYSKKFIIPTIEEIAEYCGSRQSSVSAIKFFNHYESNGWMVGKNKMKNWKSAIATWENSEYAKPISRPSGIISQTEQDRRAGQYGGEAPAKFLNIEYD